MTPISNAFAWLTHEEFKQLSTEAKVMYLAEAMQALASERGSIFAEQMPLQHKPKLTLQ